MSNSASNNGKVRVKPHVHGQWACHVYITGEFLDTLLLERLPELTVSLKYIHPDLCSEKQPHVSLSKTFYAQHWHLERLEKSLSHALRHLSLPVEGLRFDQCGLYQNESQTRSFLALDCDHRSNQVIFPLIVAVDEALRAFGFPAFYQHPRLHVSLWWAPSINEETFKRFQSLLDCSLPLRISNLKVLLRMGNKVVQLL